MISIPAKNIKTIEPTTQHAIEEEKEEESPLKMARKLNIKVD